MKSLMLALKAAVMGAVAISAMAPLVAGAATGPWSWRDITDQLTEKNNRPIWAVARSNDGWFYTDGQNLWTGGQVYRYDGSTQVNITNDVRNAGIDRVDDIVSDNAGTVLFLQDIVRLDNNLRAIAYRNGSYANITSNIRSVLNSDEGISKINGRNGTWYIVTTKGRLFRFDSIALSAAQIALPALVRNEISYSADAYLYNVNNGSASMRASGLMRTVPLDIVPIANNNWLVVVDPAGPVAGYNSTNGAVIFYRFDGTTFTDITSTVATGVKAVHKIASNGTVALISTDSLNDTAEIIYNYATDGVTTKSASIGGGAQLTDAVIAWNGTSWLIANGKDLYRLTGAFPSGNAAESFGRTNDLIISAAGDANGKFLLGGAASTQSSNDPTSPLTAKLILLVEDGGISDGGTTTGSNELTVGGTFGGDRVHTSTLGPRVTIQGNPASFRVKNGGEFAYRATASDPDGVDRIDLYVNDARIKTCKSNVCEYRATYWLKGESTRTVKFWVRTTDKVGESTETRPSPDVLTVDVNSSETANGTVSTGTDTDTDEGKIDPGTGIARWDWLLPNVTSINGGEQTTYTVGAWDTDGIQKIEIIVNGNVKQTCNLNNATGNVQCAAVINANDYAANANIFVNAKVTDAKGNTSWTDGKNVFRNGTATGGTTNIETSTWTWLDPDQTTLSANGRIAFNVGAQDANGIQKIEIIVNGNVKKTCALNNTTSNATCAYDLFASDFTPNTDITATGKVTDANGNVAWSQSRVIRRASEGTTTPTENTVSAWDWLEPTVSSITTSQSIAFHAGGWASAGVNDITVYVNGNTLPACTFSSAMGNVECAKTILGSSYAPGSSIFVNARVRDASGREAWSSGRTFSVTSAGTTPAPTPTPSNANGTVSAFSNRDGGYAAGEAVTVTANASDPDGLQRIEIFMNAERMQTCTAATCSVTSAKYSSLSMIKYYAVAYDVNGNFTKSSETAILKK